MHIYVFPLFWHVAPFKHGLLKHALTFRVDQYDKFKLCYFKDNLNSIHIWQFVPE